MAVWAKTPIPKYAVSPRTQNALRGPDKRLPVHETRFVYTSRRNGQRFERTCRVAIQPASIKTKDGYVDFYPSTDEELVDEVIRKIFADQQCGLHDPDNVESWVRFSVQNKPIGVSRYQLSSTLPDALKTSLPTLEEVEQGLSDENRQESGE